MSSDRRVIGQLNGVPIVESQPGDHMFSHLLEGDRPGEEKIACTCGWISESAPPLAADLDTHFAEVNGISYAEQKARTARILRELCVNTRSDPGRGN
jgi:hypothetical protein